MVTKASEPGLNTVQLIASGAVQLIINTPLGQQAFEDQAAMRGTAIQHNILLISTMSAAQAAVSGIKALRRKELRVRSLQRHHAKSASDSVHS
jgi:carbamoyl-phosphate synthase large subunit